MKMAGLNPAVSKSVGILKPLRFSQWPGFYTPATYARLGSIGSVLCNSVVSSPFDDSISQEGP